MNNRGSGKERLIKDVLKISQIIKIKHLEAAESGLLNMLRCISGETVPDISKDCSAFIFRVSTPSTVTPRVLKITGWCKEHKYIKRLFNVSLI
jgi:hypothetical protein